MAGWVMILMSLMFELVTIMVFFAVGMGGQSFLLEELAFGGFDLLSVFAFVTFVQQAELCLSYLS